MITVNGEGLDWHEGMTVRDIIRARKFTFPMLAVWVDDSPVPRDAFDMTVVPDGATVQIIHMISGG